MVTYIMMSVLRGVGYMLWNVVADVVWDKVCLYRESTTRACSNLQGMCAVLPMYVGLDKS